MLLVPKTTRSRVEKESLPSLWSSALVRYRTRTSRSTGDALSHIDQPQPSRSSDLVGSATDAIIGHREPNATVGPRKSNLNLLGLRIFGGIAECFLNDAVDIQRGPR